MRKNSLSYVYVIFGLALIGAGLVFMKTGVIRRAS